MRHLFAFFSFCFCQASTFTAVAQTPSPTSRPTKKNQLPEKVEGYQRNTIEGFTLLLSKDVVKADTKAFEVKPLAVLEHELKIVAKILTAKQLETLRKLIIWVEWDEQHELTNGRNGSAIAVYYGGHQASLLEQGKHPLKAKTITILSMKALTDEHQPNRDSGRCVLLHELVHAVHDQLLGRDHAGIRAAYTQAMERKLYDKTQYVSTNEAEFFAETTAAYFDQLHHYPQTREDLKKHDPATHTLLESIWGTTKKPEPASTKPKGLLTSNGIGQFDMTVKLDNLLFESQIHGPAFKPEQLQKRVAIVGFIGMADLPVLGKLKQIHNELAAYGATIVVGPGQMSEANEWQKLLSAREVPFSAVSALMLRDNASPKQFVGQKPSHTLVFDANGNCVFRGSGHDALAHARAAVGNIYAAQLGAGILDKPMKPLTDILVSGQPLSDVIPKLTAVSRSSDEAASKRANELLNQLTAPGKAVLEEAKILAKTDQLGAFLLLESEPQRYQGSPLAEKLTAALDGLKETPVVVAELKARSLFEPIRKLEGSLQALPGGFNPAETSFRQRHAATIGQLNIAVEELKKKYPKAKVTAQAIKLVQAYTH
jgi:hypothetical protein